MIFKTKNNFYVYDFTSLVFKALERHIDIGTWFTTKKIRVNYIKHCIVKTSGVD